MLDDDATHPVQDRIDPAPRGTLKSGDRLRDWTLGEVIGRGGSSVVFEATRSDGGFVQRAAVKVLHTVFHDQGFVARFERERRILVGLTHPHIVRLLDGGQTRDGVPWYAMEPIDGQTLTAWGAQRPLNERVRVVIDVARAVDHAHRRLVVHCDLKPDNVLVDRSDAPHVLDFGIARLLDEDERTGTLAMATPRWAAPEQLEGRAVTTATDVHALGLLLWACLTGEEPRRDVSGPALQLAAATPLPPPSHVEHRARGDLDAIVLRATATDPAERYRSAADLADDLQRALRGEAVRAREGLAWYRLRHGLRRHRGLVAATASAALLLLAWATTTSLQAAHIRSERDRAEATLDLLVGILEAADPDEAHGEELTVREVLHSSLRELEVADHPPEVAGQVRLAAGRVQAAVGAREEALASLRRAHQELAGALGVDDPRTLRAEMQVAFTAFGNHVDRADHTAQMRSVARRLDDAHLPADAGQAYMYLAQMSLDLGDTALALAHAERARQRLLRAEDHRAAARALAIHGYTLAHLDPSGRRAQGVEEMNQALQETIEVLGTREHPAVADILHELALATKPVDLSLFEESVALRERLYGPSWRLAAALSNLALALEPTAPERAIQTTRRAHAMARDQRGAEHPDVLRIEANLGALLMDAGHHDEALEVLVRVVGRPTLPESTRAKAEERLIELRGSP